MVDADRAAWVRDRMGWIAGRMGRALFLTGRPLVLPTLEFFTAGRGEDTGTAEAVVGDIARIMGMSDWPVVLEPMPELPEGMGHSYQALFATGGTFQVDETGAVIRYLPSMMRMPVPFISTMAHEMSHYWLAPLWEDWPGGAEEHELVTDLTAIAHGFGVIQMMAADAQGWAGYLSQETRAYALALFLRVTGQEPEEAEAHMSGRPRKLLGRALDLLDADPAPVNALRRGRA